MSTPLVPASAETASAVDPLTGLSSIGGFFSDAKTLIDAALWLVNPASWFRIGAFVLAIILLIFAIYAFVRVGDDQPLFRMPQVAPVPVPV